MMATWLVKDPNYLRQGWPGGRGRPRLQSNKTSWGGQLTDLDCVVFCRRGLPHQCYDLLLCTEYEVWYCEHCHPQSPVIICHQFCDSDQMTGLRYQMTHSHRDQTIQFYKCLCRQVIFSSGYANLPDTFVDCLNRLFISKFAILMYMILPFSDQFSFK